MEIECSQDQTFWHSHLMYAFASETFSRDFNEGCGGEAQKGILA